MNYIQSKLHKSRTNSVKLTELRKELNSDFQELGPLLEQMCHSNDQEIWTWKLYEEDIMDPNNHP
jgi:hypothetical protein